MQKTEEIEKKIKELRLKQKELIKKEKEKEIKEVEKFLFYIDKEIFENLEKSIGKETKVSVKNEEGKSELAPKIITKNAMKKAINRRLSYLSYELSDFE